MQDTKRAALVGDSPTSSDQNAGQPSNSASERPLHARCLEGFLRIRTLESFQHPGFRLLWATMFGASASGWIVNVVIGWLTFRLTGSPLLTGLAIGLGAVPPVIVGPIAGVLIDAWDRQKALAVALGSWAVSIAGFGAIVIVGPVAPWHIFVFALLTGLAGSLLVPAEQALLANVVPKRLYLNGFALAGVAGSITRLMAPAFTGFSIALIGPGATLMLAVVFLLVATKSTLMIEARNDNRHRLRPETVLSDLMEAASYMLSNRVVVALTLLIAAFLLLMTPINMGLMPVYAERVFSGGPQLLGLLIAALGAGNTIGAVLLASIAGIRRRGMIIALTASLTGGGLLALSQSGTLVLAFPILVFYGATMVITWTVASAAIQSMAPDNLRGRVAALSAATHVAFPVGTLIVGGLAQVYGAPAATAVSGTLLIAVVLLLHVAFRGVWSFRTDDDEQGYETVGTLTPGKTLVPRGQASQAAMTSGQP